MRKRARSLRRAGALAVVTGALLLASVRTSQAQQPVESEDLTPSATPTPTPAPTAAPPAGISPGAGAPAETAGEPGITEAAAEEKYAAGDLDGAAALYRQLAVGAGEPRDRMRLLVTAAWLEQELGQRAEASDLLRQGLLDMPDYPFQAQNYSQEFVDLYQEARKRALAERHDRASELVRRSLQEMASDDLPRARITLQQALALAPDDPFALYNAALVELKSDHRDEALTRFEKLMALDAAKPGLLPDEVRASAASSLGLLYYKKDFLDDARRYLEQAVAIDARNTRAWNNLGLMRQKAKDVEGAEQAYRKALEIAPDDNQVTSNLALLYVAQQRWADAVSLLTAATTRAPTDGFAWLNLGLAQRGAGDRTGAVVSLQKAMTLDPGNKLGYAAHAASYLAVVRLEQQDATGAATAAKQAIDWQPSDVDAWVYLGLAQKAQGDLAGARDSLQKAAALDPARADVQNNLGTVLVATGDLAGAEAAFRQALTLKPGFPDAQANLDQVLTRQLAARVGTDAGKPASAPPAHHRQPKFIGIHFSDTDFTYLGIRGAVVDSVSGESPAERAGIKKGDVILGVDGKPVQGPQQLLRYLRELTGERDFVEMDVLRGGQPRRLRVDMF